MNIIYLKYQRIGNIMVNLMDGMKTYVAVTKNDISLLAAESDDVPQLLGKRCGCCDNYFTCFTLATPEDITRWNMTE